MIIEAKRLGFSYSISPDAPEVFTLKERDEMLRQLRGKRICIDFQEDIDGPQTAATLIKETLQNFGTIFKDLKKDLKEEVDAYVWIQQGSGAMRFAFVVADPFDKNQYLCYECGPQELTASVMTAIFNFFHRFRKPRTISPRLEKLQELISSLDTADHGILQRIEDEIVQYGERSLDALLASVNDCNRRITAACLAQDWKAAIAGMQALERRIRVLGRIKSPRAVPALLDALADSAGAAELTGLPTVPAARSLCQTAADALVNIGETTIPYLKDNINDRRLPVRKAVRSVLSRIHPKKWWQFWK